MEVSMGLPTSPPRPHPRPRPSASVTQNTAAVTVLVILWSALCVADRGIFFFLKQYVLKGILGFCVLLQRAASLVAQTIKNSPAMQETQV